VTRRNIPTAETEALMAEDEAAPKSMLCSGGLWWRLSAMEPQGPGSWQCRTCYPPDPAVWVDGLALPTRKGMQA
jgi:hypothetical protein